MRIARNAVRILCPVRKFDMIGTLVTDREVVTLLDYTKLFKKTPTLALQHSSFSNNREKPAAITNLPVVWRIVC